MSCLLSMMMMVIQKRKILDWRTLPFQPPTGGERRIFVGFDPLDDDYGDDEDNDADGLQQIPAIWG